MAAELTEGETYTVRATITNLSTKAGAPVAAVLTVNIAGVVDSQTILDDSAVYGFAASEVHAFDFTLSVPIGTGGKAGAVVAEVLDPNGNKLADGSLDVIIAPVGPTVSASWDTYFTSRYGGGQFVIATVKVSSPRAFVGRVVVSLPLKISGDVLYTPEQWQTLLDQMQWILDNYCPTLADPWRCKHTYELGIQRVSAWPTIEGFYLSASGIDNYTEYHIENLAKATSERSYDVDAFPAGDTEIQFGFFIKAGKTKYSDGRWCIGYEPGLHLLSPAVTLYEYVNPYYDEKHYLRGTLAQLTSVSYKDAIQFEGQSAGTYDWAERYCSW